MNKNALEKIKKNYKGRRQALLPCLHFIQEREGYINEEAITFLSKLLNVSCADIYGVISFYSLFSFKPQGKYVIRACNSLLCYFKGSNNILSNLKEILNVETGETTADGKFTLEEVPCLGLCDKSPAMVINNKEYLELTPRKIKEIIESYENNS